MLYPKSIKYPYTFNIVSGETDLDSNLVSINACLALLLTTAKNELLGDPDFGCRLYEMLFEQASDDFIMDVKQEIVDEIAKYESRIIVSLNDIDIQHMENTDRNSYHITINYTVKNTNLSTSTDIILEERVVSG